MENELKYYNERLDCLLEEIVDKTVLNKPDNPAEFIYNFLIQKGNYESLNTPLNEDEISELNKLRIEYAIMLREDLLNKNNQPKASKSMRKSIFSESYGLYNKFEPFNEVSIKKPDSLILSIYNSFKGNIIFSELTKSTSKPLINSMKEKVLKKDEVLVTEGEEINKMYFIETGILGAFQKGELTRNYFHGEAINIISLMYITKSDYTVKALENCLLWELERNKFKAYVQYRSEQKEREYFEFLKKVPLFKDFSDNTILQICSVIKEKKFYSPQIIIRKGDQGDEFFIVKKGKAVATVQGDNGIQNELLNYGEGDFFGELALLTAKPRQTNIFATTDVIVLVIDRSSFKRLLGPLVTFFEKNKEKYEELMKKINE